MSLTEPYLAKGETAAALIYQDIVDVGLDVSLILYLESHLEGTAHLNAGFCGQIHFAQQGCIATQPAMGTQAGMLRVRGIELPHVVVLLAGYGEADASRELLHLCHHLYGIRKLLVRWVNRRTILQQQSVIDEED